MDELIVVDEEYDEYITALDKLSEVIEQKVETYVLEMKEIGDNIISEGEVSDNIKLFAYCASGLQGLTNDVMQAMQDSISDFLCDIDAADEYIYQ